MKNLQKSIFLLIFLFLVACSQISVTPIDSPTATAPELKEETTLKEPLFQNPILQENFADPFILKVDSTYFVYATNSSGKNISLAKSDDLIQWQILGDAMPALPKWAKLTGGLVWAPEVININDSYIMYYTARDKVSNKQCVGVAISDNPEGKFKDINSTPLVCQAESGGTIDASPFRDDDGKLYLYYKNDGNCCNLATFIYVQELKQDGLALVGTPISLIRNDKAWEGHVIEAPTMFKHDDIYYLFFSANNYAGHEYAVGYAICESPLGPCIDAEENPILASDLDNNDAMVIGPGHQTIIEVNGQTWIIYHAWEVVSNSRRGDRRFMWMDRIEWVNGIPKVLGPTTTEQPIP